MDSLLGRQSLLLPVLFSVVPDTLEIRAALKETNLNILASSLEQTWNMEGKNILTVFSSALVFISPKVI